MVESLSQQASREEWTEFFNKHGLKTLKEWKNSVYSNNISEPLSLLENYFKRDDENLLRFFWIIKRKEIEQGLDTKKAIENSRAALAEFSNKRVDIDTFFWEVDKNPWRYLSSILKSFFEFVDERRVFESFSENKSKETKTSLSQTNSIPENVTPKKYRRNYLRRHPVIFGTPEEHSIRESGTTAHIDKKGSDIIARVKDGEVLPPE